jgi:hypothetical protein
MELRELALPGLGPAPVCPWPRKSVSRFQVDG